jgi:hypothetical protein
MELKEFIKQSVIDIIDSIIDLYSKRNRMRISQAEIKCKQRG